MATSKTDLLTANLFFYAAFPVMQVALADDPKLKKKFENVTAEVEISAADEENPMVCHLKFDAGNVTVVPLPAPKPDIVLAFSSIAKMNDMFKGGSSLPSIKGFSKPGLLIKVLMLLLSLKLMMPSARPTDPVKKAMKVKMSLYMVTRALSYCNKNNALGVHEWALHQPDRIYQFMVRPYPESGIACYLRVKAGNSKSGHGVYTRRTPFVLFDFKSVDGALKVLLKDVEFVSGVEQGCVETLGSPEYACQLNDFMAVIQGMLT